MCQKNKNKNKKIQHRIDLYIFLKDHMKRNTLDC